MKLVDFLLARIAEDEAVAVAAGGDKWGVRALMRHPDSPVTVYRPGKRTESGKLSDLIEYKDDPLGYYATRFPANIAEHIARWDPARVLAECEAKRRIVSRAELVLRGEGVGMFNEGQRIDARDHLRALALPYADHPDYREEWRP